MFCMYSRKTAKIIMIAAVFGVMALYSRAQDRAAYTVGYYKQTAVVVKGQRSAGDGTGQFICITGKSCYDSDKDGYTVENGALSYLGLTDGGYHNYYGGSFWGEANYYFTKDYSRLNIQLRNEEKTYVYEKAAAPSGALTSAKIKAKPAPAEDSDSIVIPPVTPAGTNTAWGTTPPPPLPHTRSLRETGGFFYGGCGIIRLPCRIMPSEFLRSKNSS